MATVEITISSETGLKAIAKDPQEAKPMPSPVDQLVKLNQHQQQQTLKKGTQKIQRIY